MCYILYGAMDRVADDCEYAQVSANYAYRFRLGSKHDIKMCVANQGEDFRVTDWVCDCEFPVGEKNETAEELQELASLIRSLRSVKEANCLYLCKTWTGKRNKQEHSVQIDEIDLPAFLANMERNCLYQICF